MKLNNLEEMINFHKHYRGNPDILIDLGGRKRALVGVVDDRDGVVLKISDRPSEKQYFVMEESDEGYVEVSSVETTIVDIGTLAEMYPDSIYFEATLLT